MNMFQNFAPLVFDRVANRRGEIIYAKVSDADPLCPVKSLAIRNGFDALLHAANFVCRIVTTTPV